MFLLFSLFSWYKVKVCGCNHCLILSFAFVGFPTSWIGALPMQSNAKIISFFFSLPMLKNKHCVQPSLFGAGGIFWLLSNSNDEGTIRNYITLPSLILLGRRREYFLDMSIFVWALLKELTPLWDMQEWVPLSMLNVQIRREGYHWKAQIVPNCRFYHIFSSSAVILLVIFVFHM